MRVRKATISGAVVDPNAMASPNPHAPSPTLHVQSAFELSFTLGDLRPQFFRAYADWLADMREYPDPDPAFRHIPPTLAVECPFQVS